MTGKEIKKTGDLLRKHNFKFKKRFGQNFISDVNLLEKIAQKADLTKDDLVLEIGPGAGNLTKVLADQAGHVLALEIDRTLMAVLEEQLKGYDNVTLLNLDALKEDFDQIVGQHFPAYKSYKIVANLPYYITSPLIFKGLEDAQALTKMVVMVQKEVAQRLQADPGGKDYGALTLMANYYAQVTYEFTVARGLFTPQPDVDSAIVSFVKHDQRPLEGKEEEFFKKLVKAAFSQRRKTLFNAIKTLDLPRDQVLEILVAHGFDEKVRAERLPLEVFLKISKTFC